MLISYTSNMSLSIGSNSFQLNNVYVIPSMRKNLLSIAQLFYDNNVLCAFDSQHFYIFDHSNGSLLFQGLCKNGLYKLPSLPSHISCLFASLQSSSIWHSRLGHHSSNIMSFLGKKHLLGSQFKFQKYFL